MKEWRTRSYELVVYDPKDIDTYPSVCVFRKEVRERFGFVGGEVLLFDGCGKYLGQVVNQLEEETHA